MKLFLYVPLIEISSSTQTDFSLAHYGQIKHFIDAESFYFRSEASSWDSVLIVMRAAKARTSLRICTGSSELFLLANTWKWKRKSKDKTYTSGLTGYHNGRLKWNCFKPSCKIFYWPFLGGTSFVDHLCYLCLVFVMLSRLFIAALWSPAGKGLTSWLLFVMFNCVFVVSRVRCGTWLYQILIFVIFLTLTHICDNYHGQME